MIQHFRLAEYTSKNSGDRRKIAAKIIDRNKAPDDFLKKFLPRELDIYLKLDHQNIIKVFEIIEIMHRVYIFMELAECGDLLEFIRVKKKKTLFILKFFLILIEPL